MADGPDIAQQMLQMQSMIAAANGTQGKGLPLLAGVLPGSAKDVDVGQSLSPKGKGLNSDSMALKLPQGRPTMAQSLLKSLGLTREDIAKTLSDVNSKGAVQQMQFAQANISDITGQAPAGGFAANLGPRGGGGMDFA